jgi:hypothetical protein
MTESAADLFGASRNGASNRRDPLFLRGLRVRNYRRLSAVDLEFGPNGLIEVRGANEQGKTSLLDAIWETLQGAPRPDAIRAGEREAESEVNLGALIVTRRWRRTDDGGVSTSLTVRWATGERVPKPQELLDGLLSRVAIDPLAWVELGERGAEGRRKQRDALVEAVAPRVPREELRDILGPLDLAADERGHALDVISKAKKAVAEMRTVAGRRLADADATVRALEERVPTGAADAPAITREELRNATTAYERARDAQAAAKMARETVENLKRMLEDATRRADAADLAAAAAGSPEEHRQRAEAMRDLAANAELVAGVRAERVKRDAARAVVERHTAALAAIDQLLATTLAEVRMPVEGLAFDEDGLTYKGRPFPSSASGEERIVVGLGVAMASAPQLRLLRVDDGNRLDSFNRARVRQMIEEQGFQLLMVLVDDQPDEHGPGIVIEDGVARAIEGTPKKARARRQREPEPTRSEADEAEQRIASGDYDDEGREGEPS